MSDVRSEHQEETAPKDDTAAGEAGKAATPDPKPEGAGPVDKKPEIEQQPT